MSSSKLAHFASLVALVFPLSVSAAPGKEGKKSGAKVEAKAKTKGKAKGEGKAEKPEKKGENEQAAKLDAERSSGSTLQKWKAENQMLDVGLSAGIAIPSKEHGLFDPGGGQRPELAPVAADIGARIEYFPLAFLGVGFEGGVAPTRSPELSASTTIFAARGHLIGQLPYRLTPMLFLGGGVIGNSAPAPRLNSSKGAFHWGAGLKFHMNKWVALRLDGRQVVADTGASRFSVGEVLVGVDVTVRLRDWIKPRKPRDKDSDADGVSDSKDPCPATPGTDGHGCPPHLRDIDDDGKKDNVDKCPREPGDTPSGCPLQDKDRDGIPDGRDDCVEEAESVNGWKDTDGCPDEVPEDVAAFTGVIKGINFDSGKAKIRKSSYKILDRAAKTLLEHTSMKIAIVGHTDDVGEREANMDLSQRRADSVKAYFVKKGVEEERLTTYGAGPDEPLADNATKKGRSQNRRIEFRLVGQ